MNSKYMIKEFFNNDIGFKIHVINISNDNHKGGWYSQIGAAEGMIERSGKRWFKYWNKKNDKFKSQVKFDRWRENDEKTYLKMQSNFFEKYNKKEGIKVFPEFDKIEHDSVWDFFEYIDYDYKNKKVSNTDTLIHIIPIKS